MKILCWNTRGAAHLDTHKVLKDMVTKDKPMMIFLLETKLPASQAEEARQYLDYDSVQGIDADGFSGGIWMI